VFADSLQDAGMRKKLLHPLCISSLLLSCIASPVLSQTDTAPLARILEPEKLAPVNIHSVLVSHKGAIVSENYYRGTDRPMGDWQAKEKQFTANDLHDMRSISKTVVGLAVGIAIDEGKIASVTMPLDQRPELQISHLLSMTTGLQWHEAVGTYGTLANHETQLFFRPWRTNYVLGKERLHAPGAMFNYSGGSTHVLADIVSNKVGEPFTDYIAKKLFKPLNIVEYEWRSDIHFRPVSFAGLRLKPNDLLKIGQLMLNKGVWQGQQVISKQWIDESFKPRVSVDRERRYGYHWWLGSVAVNNQEHSFAAAVGNGGQRLIVSPTLELAVVVTAGQYNSATIGPQLYKLFEAIANNLPQ
jgi:CubicO group peptidase (beta-lactamase class C family)